MKKADKDPEEYFEFIRSKLRGDDTRGLDKALSKVIVEELNQMNNKND